MAAAGATDGGCAALFDVHLHVVLFRLSLLVCCADSVYIG